MLVCRSWPATDSVSNSPLRKAPFSMPAHVHHFILHAAAAHQLLLIERLQASDAEVVAGHVLGVLGLFQEGRGDGAHVAQGVGHVLGLVGAGHAGLDAEAGKVDQVILDGGQLGGTQVLHQRGGLHPRVGPGGFQGRAQLLHRQLQQLAEAGRVELLNLAGHHHQVVYGRVLHQNLAVAVIDQAPVGHLHQALERVAVGGQLIAAVEHLDVEEAGPKHQCHRQEDGVDHVFAAFEVLQSEKKLRVNALRPAAGFAKVVSSRMGKR